MHGTETDFHFWQAMIVVYQLGCDRYLRTAPRTDQALIAISANANFDVATPGTPRSLWSAKLASSGCEAYDLFCSAADNLIVVLPLQCSSNRPCETVDLIASVIESKGRTHGAFDAEARHRRLRAMMSGADCNPFLVEYLAHLLGGNLVSHK